jgi:hypothetical protein
MANLFAPTPIHPPHFLFIPTLFPPPITHITSTARTTTSNLVRTSDRRWPRVERDRQEPPEEHGWGGDDEG